MTSAVYSVLLKNWDVEFSEAENASEIQGSPDRVLERKLVRDTAGCRWVLERINKNNLERKQQIASQLDALCASGLSAVFPWKRTLQNDFVSIVEGQCWMVRPFVEGVALDRTSYLNELWRAEAMARFLIELPAHSPGLGSFFSIASYAEDCMKRWAVHAPALTEQLSPAFLVLKQTFFPIHDQLPTSFCHGDFHPLNIVWGRDSIRSVIDWEFCGWKPELYDAALLLGCIGFIDPDHLLGDFVIHLVGALRANGSFSARSWTHLFELMATIRYGWMSEWIRRKDREAIEMEALYIDILVFQKEYILKRWNDAACGKPDSGFAASGSLC